MPRLINAEKLEKYKADCCVPLTEWQEGWNDAIDTIMDEEPTVDAVEVVRCKDCIYSSPFDEEELKYPYRVGEWRCEYWGYAEMHEDDYCSCGKRRKDETDS